MKKCLSLCCALVICMIPSLFMCACNEKNNYGWDFDHAIDIREFGILTNDEEYKLQYKIGSLKEGESIVMQYSGNDANFTFGQTTRVVHNLQNGSCIAAKGEVEIYNAYNGSNEGSYLLRAYYEKDSEYKALNTGYCGSCRRNYIFLVDLNTKEKVTTFPIYIKITALVDLDRDSVFVMQED